MGERPRRLMPEILNIPSWEKLNKEAIARQAGWAEGGAVSKETLRAVRRAIFTEAKRGNRSAVGWVHINHTESKRDDATKLVRIGRKLVPMTATDQKIEDKWHDLGTPINIRPKKLARIVGAAEITVELFFKKRAAAGDPLAIRYLGFRAERSSGQMTPSILLRYPVSLTQLEAKVLHLIERPNLYGQALRVVKARGGVEKLMHNDLIQLSGCSRDVVDNALSKLAGEGHPVAIALKDNFASTRPSDFRWPKDSGQTRQGLSDEEIRARAEERARTLSPAMALQFLDDERRYTGMLTDDIRIRFLAAKISKRNGFRQ